MMNQDKVDVTKLNIQEQVQYLTDYHQANQGIASWGIRVVGQINDAKDLPDPYDGEYGDAYAVGVEAPYFFYIWTRASISGGSAYWFPFGEISIVGPQGPRGEKGDKGATGQSTQWFATNTVTNILNANTGDLCLITSGPNLGNIYRYEVGNWDLFANIKGPQGSQGPQGIQGEKGDTGERGPQGERGESAGYINIIGILSNADQLPSPSLLNNMTYAYLIGTGEPHDVYIQVGTSPATSVWHNAGPLNGATLVQANGQYQATWNADTKVNKVSTANIIYATDGNGNQTSVPYSAGIRNGAIAMRNSAGDITVPNNPATDEAAINTHRARSLIASESQQVWLHTVETDSGNMITFLSVYPEKFLIEEIIAGGRTVYTLEPATMINWNFRYNDQPIFLIYSQSDPTMFRVSYYDNYDSFMGAYEDIIITDPEDGRYTVQEAINWY